VIALNDPLRAKATLQELKAAGLSAYILDPPASDPEAPYRVRVGPFSSRAEAETAAAELGKARGQKLWVIRER
jgi:cell division septation protein DedD